MKNPIVITCQDERGNYVNYNCFEVPVENENYCKIVNENGDLAIAITQGYGGGWSSWNDNNQQMVIDSKIIKLIGNVEYSNKEVKKYNKKFPKNKVEFDLQSRIDFNQQCNDYDSDDYNDDDSEEEEEEEEEKNEKKKKYKGLYKNYNNEVNYKRLSKKKVKNDEDTQKKFLKSTLKWSKIPDLKLFGFNHLEIRFIPKGKEFYIDEYDGIESICFKDDIDWISS
jgi:hypothetical protein